MPKKQLPPELQQWIEARRRFGLSHAHVQMARELGMNPKKLGKLANHHQEQWKAPLSVFIEDCYFKRFGRERPENVMSIEDRHRAKRAKLHAKKLAKQERKLRALDLDGPSVLEHQQQGPSGSDDPRPWKHEDCPF